MKQYTEFGLILKQALDNANMTAYRLCKIVDVSDPELRIAMIKTKNPRTLIEKIVLKQAELGFKKEDLDKILAFQKNIHTKNYVSKQATPKKEPWQIIMDNIKIDISNKEYLAKCLTGEKIESFSINRAQHGEFIDMAELIRSAVNTECREKPKQKKLSSWWVDAVVGDNYGVFSFSTKAKAEKGIKDYQHNTSVKILSEPYLKECVIEEK